MPGMARWRRHWRVWKMPHVVTGLRPGRRGDGRAGGYRFIGRGWGDGIVRVHIQVRKQREPEHSCKQYALHDARQPDVPRHHIAGASLVICEQRSGSCREELRICHRGGPRRRERKRGGQPQTDSCRAARTIQPRPVDFCPLAVVTMTGHGTPPHNVMGLRHAGLDLYQSESTPLGSGLRLMAWVEWEAALSAGRRRRSFDRR